jgi:hypothetical protein
MGGFDALMLGDDKDVSGYVLISAANLAKSRALNGTAQQRAGFADEASYTNATPDSLAADVTAHAQGWDWVKRAALLAPRPVLIVTSDDGLAPTDETVATAVKTAGGPAPSLVHMTTDHSYNDHRIALATTIADWLKVQFAGQ